MGDDCQGSMTDKACLMTKSSPVFESTFRHCILARLGGVLARGDMIEYNLVIL